MKKLIYIGMMCVFALTAFAQEPEQIDLEKILSLKDDPIAQRFLSEMAMYDGR